MSDENRTEKTNLAYSWGNGEEYHVWISYFPNSIAAGHLGASWIPAVDPTENSVAGGSQDMVWEHTSWCKGYWRKLNM